MRPKKCAECGEKYQPTRQMQPCCDKDECKLSFAVRHAEVSRKRRQLRAAQAERVAAMEDRKTIKLKLEKLKPLSKWLKEAQAACNVYIRERDKDKPCISCGRFHQGAYDAGHYRSVGAAPSLRFDEANIHRQCVPCNQHKSGNVIEYRLGLIQRIGQAEVERLEGPLEVVKYTIEDAKRIKAEFVAKLKELKT